MLGSSSISETSISELPENIEVPAGEPKNVVRPRLSRIVYATVLEAKQK
jgi:hypothetical protein